ncbi:MAG TPA: PQQ-binding-like beta-propeller repeat protein [Spirochaetia bacterium]|nr:PQQ-binding-like beta-propeller repeat protein [Spirochaetia bacterium]
MKSRHAILAASVVCSIVAFVSATSESPAPEQAEFSWRYATGGQIRSRPAIASDGTVYAVAEDGYLYALSPAGRLVWKCDLGWLPGDCLAVSPDGMIYAGLKNRDLIAVNPRGAVAWRITFDGFFVGDPLVAPDGTVYIGEAPGTLVSMSELGRRQWSVTLPGSLLAGPVMDGAGTIYLVASDRRLYALTQWGEFKWSLPVATAIATPAIADDGTVLIGTDDGQIIAVSPGGDVRWRRAAQAPVVGISVGVDLIVAATEDGLILGVSTDGRELWRESVPARLDSSPLLRGSSVLELGRDGTLFILHLPGRDVERLKIGTTGAAALARDGTVYLGGRDWVVYAFPRPAPGAWVVGSWPQPGHDGQHSGYTPSGPRGGVEAALNANPDYAYLESLAGSQDREQNVLFLSEIQSRIARSSLGKSTWYVVRLLEALAGSGLITPIYQNQKTINDFPDLRAEASAVLGMTGSASSRWMLLRIVAAETDSAALSAEVRALGDLTVDGDDASARTIAAAFVRLGTSPPDNRLAAATVDALDRIATYRGAISPSSVETLISIYHGPYVAEVRSAALTAIERDRRPISAP